MATVAESLFGVTPESLQRQRQQQLRQEAMDFVSISDPFQQANFAIYQGAGNLARGVGGLLGAQDPELMRVRQRQELLQGVDIADPLALRQAATVALQNGDNAAAQELARRALDIEKTQAGIAKDVAAAGASTAAANRDRSPNEPADIVKARRIAAIKQALPVYESAGDKDTVNLLTNELAALEPADKLPSFGEEANRIAVATFGKPFAQLTQAQANQIDKVVEKRGITRAQANRSTINMPPQEKAEQSGRGTFLVKQYEDISKQAGVARRTLPALESIANILDKGFDTGFGTETITAGAKVLGALGVEGAKNLATNAESFLGAASSAVLTKQLEQKGPQTESDAQRITQTGAQLGNTKEANRFLITVAKAQLQRDIAQRNFYDSWWKKNKTYDGAEDAWETGEGSRSLFDYPELRKYRATPSAASQIPTSQGTPATPTYARNPQTGQRIMSTDGGKTWQPAR